MDAIDLLSIPVVGRREALINFIRVDVGDRFINNGKVFAVENGSGCDKCYFRLDDRIRTSARCPSVYCDFKVFVHCDEHGCI